MSNWKILISDSLAECGKELLREHAEVDDRPGITPEELLEVIGEYHALIVRSRTKVTKEVIAGGKNLQVVGRAGVGVDNIDLEAAKAHGVKVVNSPTATTTAVAEHTLALMLSMLRHIPRANASMKTGQWEKKTLEGSELNGKTLGIIGMGRIGASVAERAKAFGMNILGCDPFIREKEIEERGAQSACLKDIFNRSDLISLHIPLTPETNNLINEEAFASMKVGVFMICTARGGIINEDALLASLESGKVAGAALDVFAQEPPGLTALVSHPKVIVTPHIGAQTAEAQERAALHIAEEILKALKSELLRWQVV